MSYSDVDVNAIRLSLSVVDDLNKSSLENVLSSIDATTWESPSRTHVCDAINKIINEMNEIEELVQVYKGVIDMVEQVQQLERENVRLERDNNGFLSSLKNSLDNTFLDNTFVETGLQNKITKNANKIKENNNKIESLKRSIESAL